MNYRYPLAPLAAALGITPAPRGNPGEPDIPHGLTALAALLHVSGTTIKRYSRHGIPEAAADRLAITIAHRHPATIWPYEWETNSPGELDLATQPCKCRTEQRPENGLCDRCGSYLKHAA